MAKRDAVCGYHKKRKELAARLPASVEMLRGSLVAKFIRCGKPNCACRRGVLHGPLHYLSFKEEGATRLVYVRKNQLKAVQAQLAQFKTFESIGADICRINRKLLRLDRGGATHAGKKTVRRPPCNRHPGSTGSRG